MGAPTCVTEENMVTNRRTEFVSYLEKSCGETLDNLAQALHTTIAVLDTDGGVILTAPRDAGASVPLPGQPAAAHQYTAPIITDEDALGSLVAYSSDSQVAGLVTSIARQIGKQFDLEHDIQRMTDDLLHSYDQISLLGQYSRILRPDEGLAPNTVRLLEETASLINRRLLVQYLPRLAPTSWSAGSSQTMWDSLTWLTNDRIALRSIYSELDETTSADHDTFSLRHKGIVESPHGPVEYVVIPLMVRRKLRGFVGLFRAGMDPQFETKEIKIVETLVEELGNAGATHELNLELRELLFNVIKSLVAAIEAKDQYTGGHSERVLGCCVPVAERLGLPREEIQFLQWTAILHDVGKIAIDDEVLLKPGKLTTAEFEIIKTHPGRGAWMIEPISQLKKIIPGVRHHHERWDGKGYPDGLAGEDIPLFGRIIALADTYDAIVTTRPYRQAGPVSKALAVIKEGAGTQFDPRLAEIFLELADEGAFSHLPTGSIQETTV